jgi:uncharacterized protein with HEPN domain
LTSREQHSLLDILLKAEDAASYVRGIAYESFAEDVMKRDAVLHCRTIIGEAAGRISERVAADLPSLPWRKMKNLRNLIVHQYEGVNLPIIWNIVTVELPEVVSALDPLFPERPKP